MDNWENRFAIVILNYNCAKLTVENINNIRTISEKIHIIVVDNCSTDSSVEQLFEAVEGKEKIYFIKNDNNTGYASGNNVGLKYAGEHLKEVDTVCVMNPDIKVNKIEDFKQLYDALWNDEDLAVITAQTIYNGLIRQPNDFGWKHLDKRHMMFGGTLLGKLIKINSRYNVLKVNDDCVSYVDIVQGCFFMAKKRIISEIGYLDENTFLYEEEAILGKKVLRSNYKEGVLMNVFIHHNHHEKEKSLINKKNKLFDMNCFYNSRKYYIKNYSDESLVFINIAVAFLNLDYWVKRILKGLY